ncbi:MAG: GNAT family N-acetyltransferase [Thermoplasmata archaeon]
MTSICELREKDAEEAAEVTRECMVDAWERWERDHYPREALEFDIRHHTAEEYRKHIDLPDGFVFVAKVDDKIVGVAQGRIVGKSGLAHLGWIGVAPEFRNRGIASELLEEVEEHVRGQGCHKMHLVTLPCLTDAVRLYFRRGWVPECNLKRHWWKVDFMAMSKWLD